MWTTWKNLRFLIMRYTTALRIKYKNVLQVHIEKNNEAILKI